MNAKGDNKQKCHEEGMMESGPALEPKSGGGTRAMNYECGIQRQLAASLTKV